MPSADLVPLVRMLTATLRCHASQTPQCQSAAWLCGRAWPLGFRVSTARVGRCLQLPHPDPHFLPPMKAPTRRCTQKSPKSQIPNPNPKLTSCMTIQYNRQLSAERHTNAQLLAWPIRGLMLIQAECMCGTPDKIAADIVDGWDAYMGSIIPMTTAVYFSTAIGFGDERALKEASTCNV